MTHRFAPSLFSLFYLTLAVAFTPSISRAVCMDAPFFNTSTVRSMAIDETWLFLATNSGKVQRVRKDDASATELVSATQAIEQLTVDANAVYYVLSRFTTDQEFHQIFAVPKIGGASTLIGETTGTIAALRNDDTHLYWMVPSSAGQPDGQIQRIPKSGGSVQTIASNLSSPRDLGFDTSFVYVTESGIDDAPPYGLSRVPKIGGTLTKLFDGRAARLIAAVDGGSVYFSARQTATEDLLFRIATTGGAATAVSDALFDPSQLKRDGGRLLYSVGRFDWTHGSIGYLKAVESGSEFVLYGQPVRTFVADSTAAYAMLGTSLSGRIERLCLNYATAPRVTSLSGGSATGGSVITIFGERFQNGARAVFEGVQGEVLAVTPTEIQVKTPRHAAGIVTFYVINPDGQSTRGSIYYDPSIPNETSRRRSIRR
ncbi:MAG TPA: IPT/TIG domain-containing protein [Thermoanaerobaculia bacterium]|nr:IPT/TIG domain-containing protein [Thermoanaerobaculia bacterium]